MIAAVADCFSALKSSRKNLPIVFPIKKIGRSPDFVVLQLGSSE